LRKEGLKTCDLSIDQAHVLNRDFLKANNPVGEAGIEHQETAAIDATE
jgi:hypothetical protein